MYFILFINDFSRMTWLYFLKQNQKYLEYSPQQLTVAYSPQQNSMSERKNDTVMEMTRLMLQDK